MYRNNGLKPMKFPTPPTTDAVRNAFHHHNMTGGTTGNMNNITPTDEMTDNEDINLTIVDDTNKMDAHQQQAAKRKQRESMTPPSRVDKRQKEDKQDEDLPLPQRKKNHQNSAESLRQKQREEGIERARENLKQTKKGGGGGLLAFSFLLISGTWAP